MSEPNCKNCDKPLPGHACFCPACGQSVKGISRPWLEFVHEALSELFDYDGRMLLSMRLLLTRPGFLSYEYINDLRVSYTSPFRMYLVISLVFFYVLPLILPDTPLDTSDHKDSVVDLYSKAMFLMVPLFALLLKIFYWRTFYLAHLVFAVYLFSAMFIVFAVMLSIETLADRYVIMLLLQVAVLLYMVVYFVAALHTNYQEGWSKSALKSLALLLIFVPVLIVIIELTRRQGIS